MVAKSYFLAVEAGLQQAPRGRDGGGLRAARHARRRAPESRPRRRVRRGAEPRQHRDVPRHGAAAHARARTSAARARSAARALSGGERRHRAGACEGARPRSGRAAVGAARAPAGRRSRPIGAWPPPSIDSRKRRPRVCPRFRSRRRSTAFRATCSCSRSARIRSGARAPRLLAADIQRPRAQVAGADPHGRAAPSDRGLRPHRRARVRRGRERALRRALRRPARRGAGAREPPRIRKRSISRELVTTSAPATCERSSSSK